MAVQGTFTREDVNTPDAAQKCGGKKDEELLELAERMAAHGDALSSSGRDLSRCLNDMARDVLEANKSIEKKGTEINKLNEQLRVMELNFDKAHFQLQQAQTLTGQVIDSATVNRNVHGIVNRGMEIERHVHKLANFVMKQDVEKWPADRVERFLNVCTRRLLPCPRIHSSTYHVMCAGTTRFARSQ